MIRSAVVSCLILALTATALAAQVIEGRVVLDGWEEPVAGARVVLLDGAMAEVAATTAAEDGRFRFDGLAPGAYQLQAEHEGRFSTLAEAVGVADDDAHDAPLLLFLPSPLLDLARACFTGGREPGTGVLAGIAFEAATELALPHARVRIQWERDDEPRGERTALADAAGRFALCSVPAGRPVSAWVEAMGGVTRVETDFVVFPDAIARLDLPLELGRVAPVRVVRSETDEAEAGVVVQGRVLDEATGTPVSAAAVVLGGTGREYMTDRQGRFRFEDVEPGSHTIAVRGLGYELEPQPVELPAAAAVELELKVSPRALALEPLVVRMYSPDQRVARAMPFATRAIAGERLRLAEVRGTPIPQLLGELPGVQVMEERAWTVIEGGMPRETYGPCIQSNRVLRRLESPVRGGPPLCEMVAVVLDGVIMTDPAELLRTLHLMDLESMEFLHPLAATAWGYEASQRGALVIWTRGRGPHADRRRRRYGASGSGRRSGSPAPGAAGRWPG